MESSAATNPQAERIGHILDDAYENGGWQEARRYAISLYFSAKSGTLTMLSALDALVADGIPYETARELIDQAREAGEKIRNADA